METTIEFYEVVENTTIIIDEVADTMSLEIIETDEVTTFEFQELGVQGVSGPQGIKGDTGNQGIQGVKGDKGDVGETGPQGIQGIQGIKGDKGDVGNQGIQGVKGDKGDQGIQGIQGVKGDKGDTGDQGIQGEIGLTGPQGIKGDTGNQGIQGVKGDKGDVGETGPQGIQGIQGIKGDKGDVGNQGIQGVKGDKGDQGIQGNQGFQGVKGDKGDQGIQGEIGLTGAQGIQGIQGIKADISDAITDINTLYDYKARVLADSGTFDGAVFDKPLFGDTIGKKVYMLPSGYKASKLYDILGNDFTVSRNSTKTRIAPNGYLETLAVNVPSIEGKNLIVEPQRTNLLTYSEDFSNASWLKETSTSVVANDIISPDGTLTADKLVCDVTFVSGSPRGLNKNTSKLVNTTYNYSVFAKKGNANFIALRGVSVVGSSATPYCWFNLDNGTIGTVQGYLLPKIEYYGNGWFRCSITFTTLSTISLNRNDLILSTANGVNNCNSGEYIYIFGAQLEVGSTPTSYIPTVASTVTRLADVITITPPIGTTEIKETVNGLVNTITTIPATYTVPNGKISKIEMI